MGTSYEGLVVVGELTTVVEALAFGGFAAIVTEAAPDRIAVMPREGSYDVADVDGIATYLSARHAIPVLTHTVTDSDTLVLSVYNNGIITHRYISDMLAVGEMVETDSGFVRVVGGISYAEDDLAAPAGPVGADADRIVPFGDGEIDRVCLQGLLAAGSVAKFADDLHAEIVELLHLRLAPMVTAYRWVARGEVEIHDSTRVP